jgi:hypothetical protein
MIFDLKNFEIYDFFLILNTIIIGYVIYYYYTYFNRVNPLPGPLPFPFIGNLPQIYWWFNGDAQLFYNYCYETYGDVHEIYGSVRTIVLCRGEYVENFLSLSRTNTHWMRFPDRKVSEELGIEGKGIIFNNNFKSWLFNRHFFNQAILSPKFTDEAIDWTNKVFNELEGYWDKLYLKKKEIIKENKNKLDFSEWFDHYTNDIIVKLLTGERSYAMAAYFETLSDEKSDYPSARVEDSVKLFQELRKLLAGYSIFFVISPFLRRYVPLFKKKADEVIEIMDFITHRLNVIIRRRRQEIEDTSLDEPLPYDMLTSMITKNTLRDFNYVETGEAMRSMTDPEIRVNLVDGILSGSYKVCYLKNFMF